LTTIAMTPTYRTRPRCPRCRGFLEIIHSYNVTEHSCVNCGWYQSISQPPQDQPIPTTLRAEIARYDSIVTLHIEHGMAGESVAAHFGVTPRTVWRAMAWHRKRGE
jgi:ribosomal protein L37E